MKLTEIGEEKIIKTIKKEIGRCEGLINEIGEDDSAIIKLDKKKFAYTSDLLTRKNHFPEESPYFDIGWKTIAVNLSDIASMGASPLFSATSMGLPNLDKKDLKKLSRGMATCSEKHGLCQTGGDINRSDEIILNTSVIGEIKNHALERKNASSGQHLAITGQIGAPALALKTLKSDLNIDKELRDKCLKKLFRPEPRIEEGKNIAKEPGNAAIDISDGLFISLKQLSKASNTGIKLDLDKIPIAKEIKEEIKEHKIKREDLLEVGEDYELLFTTENENLIKQTGSKKIGEIITKKGIWVDGNKKEIKGHRHF